MGQWMKDHPEEAKTMRKRYYYSHVDSEKTRIRQRTVDTLAWIREQKEQLACIRCGETHWSCLEFHHRNPTEKDEILARVAKRGWGRERILAEMAKCDVLCANCHRKEHHP